MIDVPKRVISLFDELIARGEEIKNTCKKLAFSNNKKTIDPQFYETWKTTCLTLLRSTFGTSSPHYDSFINIKFFDFYNSTLIYLGILQSAKDDVIKGYFFHKDLMLSVNIFTSFLAKAKAYADKGCLEKATGLLEVIAFESLKKIGEAKRLTLPADGSLSELARELFVAEVLNQESRAQLEELQSYIEKGALVAPQPSIVTQPVAAAQPASAPQPSDTAQEERPRDAEQFAAWSSWLSKFIYENLGSQIVILN